MKAGGRSSTIHLLAADNNIKGVHCKGMVMDETADVSQETFDDAILPILSSHNGWALYIGTYQEGDNLLNRLFEYGQDDAFTNWESWKVDIRTSGVYSEDRIVEIKQTTSPQMWAQNYMMSGSVSLGAIYAPMLNDIKAKEQIGLFPYDRRLPVFTGWDLAYYPDYTCIWFAQINPANNQIYIIDYLQNRGEEADYYARELAKKPYMYGTAFLPHDAAQGAGKKITYEKELNKIGIKCTILPKTRDKEKAVYPVQEAISRCFFNKLNTEKGLQELYAFSMKKNKRTGTFEAKIEHNDAADAFRALIEGLLGKLSFEFNKANFRNRVFNMTVKKKTTMARGKLRLQTKRI